MMKKELSKNSKIKKAKLPFKKMSDNEKDYVAVVLEEVRDNLKVLRWKLYQLEQIYVR